MGASEGISTPGYEEKDLNVDLLPKDLDGGLLARAIIDAFKNPSRVSNYRDPLQMRLSELFRGTAIFDTKNADVVALFRELRGHLLMHTAMRNDLDKTHKDMYMRYALTLALNFEDLIPFQKIDRARFAQESGISVLCASHLDEIKDLVRADYRSQWPHRQYFTSIRDIGYIYQIAYAGKLPLYCPDLVGDDIELKSIALQHKLYRNGVVSSGALRTGPSLAVPRATPFTSAISALIGARTDELRSRLGSVRFIGETGAGVGVKREWFTVATQEIFRPDSRFFKVDKNGIYHIVPSGTNVQAFRAIGIFIGRSIIQEQPLGVRLPISYWAKMVGKDLELDDIAEEEPELVKSLRFVLAAPVEDLDMYPIELDGKALNLTPENRVSVIRRKVNSLIPHDIKHQVDALVTGFQLIVPPNIIDGIVSPQNMRDIVYGNPHIDVEDMISNMQLALYNVNDRQIVWFFKYLRGMNQQKLREFLRFVTGSSVAPLGSFNSLEPKMKILACWQSDSLPSSGTCYNRLVLPRYLSEQQLIAKFDLALANNGEMEDQ